MQLGGEGENRNWLLQHFQAHIRSKLITSQLGEGRFRILWPQASKEMLTRAVPPRVAKEYLAIRLFGKEKKTGAELRPAKPIGTLRSNDTTATRTSLKK